MTISHTNDEATTQEKTQSPLPLFYQSLTVLTAEQHKNHKLVQKNDVSFARRAHAIPLNAIEFPRAARHYPIVFPSGATPQAALAILGLRREENLFVSKKNTWTQGAYVPAYVRRYPFLLARTPQSDQFTLCADLQSGFFSQETGQELFEDGTAASTSENALNFCVAYQRDTLISDRILAKLQEHDLLAAKDGNFTLADGETLRLSDFQIVDEEKFNALSDTAFLDLRKAGALSAIYSHLLSLQNWSDLVDLAGQTKS